MECHLKTSSGLCIVASALADRSVEPWTGVCESCVSCSRPRSINYVTASAATAVHRFAGEHDMADKLTQRFGPKGYFSVGRDGQPEGKTATPTPTEGPGTELHEILKSYGEEVDASCACNHWIKEMNRKGSDWSRSRISDISDAMVKEYRKRYKGSVVPDSVLKVVAQRMVRKACNRWDQKESRGRE